MGQKFERQFEILLRLRNIQNGDVNPSIFSAHLIEIEDFRKLCVKRPNHHPYDCQVIYGLLVSPTLTFFLSFGFYFFLYKTVVKVS